MATTRTLVWTDDEVDLLLRVTLDYKTAKSLDNVDWESCQSKYYDIYRQYMEQYPSNSEGNGKDFPHENVITKAQIWGGSAAAPSALQVGLETADLQVGSGQNAEVTSRSSTPLSEFENGPTCSPTPPEVVRERREILKAMLSNHRKDRLKRRVHWDSAVEEDLRLKRRIVDILEDSERRNRARFDQITKNIASMTETIKEGFSLLCTVMQQQDSRPREPFKTEPDF